MLDALANAAPPPTSREQRTLAALDEHAAANDSVGQAEAKIRDLDQLAARASTSAERTAVDEALRLARLELRQARREQRIDDAFARYGGAIPHDQAIERRTRTIAYDALTDPPKWVVEHLRRLHEDGQLGTTRVDDRYPDRRGSRAPRPTRAPPRWLGRDRPRASYPPGTGRRDRCTRVVIRVASRAVIRDVPVGRSPA